MTRKSIISEAEARQILRNDLRRQFVEKRSADLKDATEERKAEIMAQIERDIEKELRRRTGKAVWDFLIH